MGCRSMPFAGSHGMGAQKCRFLSLDGDFTIDEIDELKNQLLTATKKEASYLINMDGITSCDTAGIQLIYSLFLQLNADLKAYAIQEESAVLTKSISAMGISLPDSVAYPECAEEEEE